MRELNPDQYLQKARMKLLSRQPFFGTLAMHLNLKEAGELVPTLGTDMQTIFYNPEFVANLAKKNFDLLISGVAHELGHTYLMHPIRRGQKDPALYNMAGDYVINAILKQCGLPLDEGWLYNEEFEGLSTEAVYERIKDDEKHKQMAQQGMGGAGVVGGDGGCCHKPPGSGPNGQTQPGDNETLEAKVKSAIAGAAQVARMQGHLPGFLSAEIDDLLNPPERWQDILREFITNLSRDDYSWQRAARNYLHRGIVLPSLYNHRMGEIVVALDSSGSCVAEFGIFLANLNSIIEDCRPELVTVMHCDARVQKVEEYTEEDLPIPNRLHGGGGTSFTPVFRAIEERDIEPECLIYFTDTYGDFPDKEPDYPVLWAVVDGADRVPFGEVVEVTDTR